MKDNKKQYIISDTTTRLLDLHRQAEVVYDQIGEVMSEALGDHYAERLITENLFDPFIDFTEAIIKLMGKMISNNLAGSDHTRL